MREACHARAHARIFFAYRFGEKQVALRFATNGRADTGAIVPLALPRAGLLQGWG